MQRCDSVMASGHSVDTFAIPALQPLVVDLFVRPEREDPERDTQREVVLSMLLRVIDHPRVLSLLTHILDCFSRSSQHWHRVGPTAFYFHQLTSSCLCVQVSSQILAALLNAVARLSLVLDTAESMATLYHLFSAMDPAAISLKVSPAQCEDELAHSVLFQALFVSLLKQPLLAGPKQLCRWLAFLNTTLTLMKSLFSESTSCSELR